MAGGNAQDLGQALGKPLRIDVDGVNSANGKYGIPAGNPFAGGGGLGEVYASGLGDPASFSFDRATFNGGGFGTEGALSGSVALTAAQLDMVVDGQTYVDFHTGANPGGEVRGQLLPQSTAVPQSAFLSGLNERPTPLTNSAGGLGLFALEGDRLSFNIAYSGLSGPATGAHIHGAAPTAGAAGMQIDLRPFNGGAFGSFGSLSGSATLKPGESNTLIEGLGYFNFHTANFPGGEIRGQVGR